MCTFQCFVLGVMSVLFTHICVSLYNIQCHCIAVWRVALPLLFIPSTVDEHLGHSQLAAVVNSIAMNICVHVFG